MEKRETKYKANMVKCCYVKNMSKGIQDLFVLFLQLSYKSEIISK